MRYTLLSLCLAFAVSGAAQTITNPLIDYPGFRSVVVATEAERPAHRLTESNFLAQMDEPGVVLLDARSESKYHLRHIRGAVNLPFTEFTADTLKSVLKDPSTKILIYCNNNFLGSPMAFASKAAPASLNLSTYTSLKTYGYTNIFELGPLLNVHTTQIPFAGTEVEAQRP